jgi:hypothetical protein
LLLNRTTLLLLTIALSFGTLGLHAQQRKVLNLPNYDKQRIHFGFILGVNTFNFIPHLANDLRVSDSVQVIQPTIGTGFTLGIVSNLHLGNNFDLRFLPSLSFGERTLVYTVNFKAQDTVLIRRKKTESTLLEFPILLKFKSDRHNNFRAYVIGGIKPSIDLASQDKVDDKGEKILKLKPNDLHTEFGVGFDFYSQYFKFTPEFKIAYGLRNILVQENNVYTTPLSSLNSRAIYISFTFE